MEKDVATSAQTRAKQPLEVTTALCSWLSLINGQFGALDPSKSCKLTLLGPASGRAL